MTFKKTHLVAMIAASAIAVFGCGGNSSAEAQSDQADIGSQTSAVGQTCSLASNQPSSCVYGEYCLPFNGKCATAPSAPCDNFTNHGRNWNPSTSTGPVIYEATAIAFLTDTIFCGSPFTTRAVFRLKAYAPTADLPTTSTGFANRFYLVTPGGSAVNATAIQNITTTNSNKNITFDVNLCLPSSVTSYTAGFFFTDGSEICATAS
ncbi:hypothetical protein HMI49_03965 [Corallococcus exercitus]|uniref:Lipoprotein n=1 Tax=Corallococcus exercitus TaxID=2316736 RepID=A0A7Y4KEL7_9BACT|nr:hypothetical protein [Corallococcus exercitus]NOK32357.1 hypothetical protein [Corallococcus exercitus]